MTVFYSKENLKTVLPAQNAMNHDLRLATFPEEDSITNLLGLD